MSDMSQIEAALQSILSEQAGMREQIKGALKRIDEQRELTESVHKMALSLERLTSMQKATDGKVDSLSRDIDELKNRPIKRWDSVAVCLITAIITAVVTFIFSKVGL